MFFQVHHEGLIIFGKEAFLNTTFRHRNFAFLPNTPSLAVFYAPVHYFSNVFSRETRDKDVIERATTYVRFSFVEDTAFSASHVFIVTWSNATRAYDRFPDEVNVAFFCWFILFLYTFLVKMYKAFLQKLKN